MNFLVSVQLKITDDESGKMKKHNETYLVDAVDTVDASAKVTEEFDGATYDWEVVSIRKTKIVKYIA